jgi:hypothetical protein
MFVLRIYFHSTKHENAKWYPWDGWWMYKQKVITKANGVVVITAGSEEMKNYCLNL